MRKVPPDSSAAQLRELTQRLFRRFGVLAADATPCGKPLPLAYAHALMTLLTRGELSQQALGRELCIDKSNVARLCARMEEAGHIEQRANDADARARRVSLTVSGLRLAGEVDAASTARFGSLLAALKPRSRRDVIEALRQLSAAIDSLPPATRTRRSLK